MDFNQLTKDFNQRYQNSWVFITFPDDTTEFVKINKAYLKESGKFPLIEIYSRELGTNTIRFTTDYKIRFKRPQIGLFQWNKYVYCCERSLEQVYAKGLNPHTYTLNLMTNRVVPLQAEYYGSDIKWGECVSHAFNPQYPTLQQALAILESGKAFMVALSRRVGISLSCNDNSSYDVYYYTHYVGKISKNGTPNFNPTDFGLNEI